MEPTFLTLDEVVEIHNDQINRYGGSPGVRDFGLLQSALAMPAAQFGGQYLHADVCEMAAAYLVHLVQNHPFIDGNKRVVAVAADVFLAMNGVVLTATEDDYEQFVMGVASSAIAKSEIAEFLRSNTSSQPSADEGQ